jgi:ABC-type cobalamin/Fe3+-siderophores transport system ATPase subunit
MNALDWPGLESLEFDAPQQAFGRKGDAPAQMPENLLLHAPAPPLDIRARLHVICALYAHARTQAHRLALLEQLEDMALETAHLLAVDLLRNGWRPD